MIFENADAGNAMHKEALGRRNTEFEREYQFFPLLHLFFFMENSALI